MRSQAQRILALDFFTADLLNGTKVCVLAVIEHGTRRVRVLDATENPVIWTDERVEAWRRDGIRPPVAVWTLRQLITFLIGVENDRWRRRGG
jgi:hypothetical protein